MIMGGSVKVCKGDKLPNFFMMCLPGVFFLMFTPIPGEIRSNLTDAYFSNGLVQPPRSLVYFPPKKVTENQRIAKACHDYGCYLINIQTAMDF